MRRNLNAIKTFLFYNDVNRVRSLLGHTIVFVNIQEQQVQTLPC